MKKTAIITTSLFLLLFCSIGLSNILHVPSEYPTIQSAIDDADDGDTVIIAPGIYTGEGNWDIGFLGKAITVRSENGPDNCIIDCNETIDYGDGRIHKERHGGFGFAGDEDANSVLDGFTITNAYAYPAIGIYDRTSPTIKNCLITGNSNYASGVIYCRSYSSPTIDNCTVSDNTGSGIYCDRDSNSLIQNSTITRNTGYGRAGSSTGGGLYIWDALCRIQNCIISGNSADRRGGGIYSQGGDLIIKNSVITSNTAGTDGGGIYWWGTHTCMGGDCIRLKPDITGCTIAGNSAGNNGGGIFLDRVSIPINSSIVWGNSDSTGTDQSAQIYLDSSSPKVWFSCIQDDNPDDANIPFGDEQWNIDDDPCFADSEYHLLASSPCIEAGDPIPSFVGQTDIDGQPRRMGPRVDIGVDEFDIKMIIVTRPKGTEVWAAGSTHEIKWDSYGITGSVDIFYSTNNGADWTMIDNVPDTGSFFWHLPCSADSNQCLVAVEPNIIYPGLISTESSIFTINPFSTPPLMPLGRGNQKIKSGPRYGCVKWKFQSDGPVTAGVAVGHNNKVYIPCENGKLYALSAGGNLLWTYDTNSPLVGSPAVGRNGTVYFGAENGKLYAIGEWGHLLWTHTADKPIYSAPTVSGVGNIYVSSLDGKLYALAHDGSELWTFETSGISPAAQGGIFASPAIDNDSVYIAGVYDPNLYALNAGHGSIKWSRRFPDPCAQVFMHRQTWPLASPVIALDGTIYQTLLYDPNLYAIDPNNGDIIWTANLADPCSGWFEPDYINQHPDEDEPSLNSYASSWSKPALAPNGTIHVSFDDPYLRAVDPNGSIKWVTRLGMMGGFTLTVGGDGLIYAACDDGWLYVVDPNGEEISRFQGTGGLTFPTITSGHTLLVSDSNNTVWAISPDCGDEPLVLRRPEDLNGDWTVNITDFALLAANWLDRTDTLWPDSFEEYPVYPEGDVDKSLFTDFADLARLANLWLN